MTTGDALARLTAGRWHRAYAGRTVEERLLRGADSLDRYCRDRALDPMALCRTIFATVLAADTGVPEIAVVTDWRRDLAGVSVATLSLHVDDVIDDAVRRWDLTTVTNSACLEQLFDAAALPAFAAAAEHAPLRAWVAASPAPMLHLNAAAGFVAPAELVALADQFEAALAVVVASPSARVADVVGALRPLHVELTIAAWEDLTEVSTVLRYWANAVGLPTEVRANQLGTRGGGRRRGGPTFLPQPPPIGATALVVRPEELEMAPGTARPLRAVEDGLFDESLGLLADGTVVAEANANETREMYDELFVRRTYLRHGVRIADDAVIIDVGTNIGLFALFAHTEAAGVRVHAFEPVSELAERARSNAARYGVDAEVYEAAVGRQPGTAELTYYPRSTMQSGLFADTARDVDVVRRYALHGAGFEVDSGVPVPLDELLVDRFESKRIVVPVTTVSALIDQRGLHRIDLLKIDAERGEEDVLAGIIGDHWDRIEQVAVEVHDVDGRLQRVLSSLRARGFAVVTEQQPSYAGTELFMVYATKAPPLSVDPARLDALLGAVRAWSTTSATPVSVVVAPAADGARHDHVVDALAKRLTATLGIGLVDLRGGGADLAHPTVALGTALFRRMTTPFRPPTKLLAVDADGVLWGGVCGEDGPGAVDVNGSYADMQRRLADERERGVLLMLVSKNDMRDVEAVFALHPEMALRLDDFVATRVSWRSKADAVAAVATELGIGLDAIVFCDDSPAERAEMRLRLPAVTVVDLPQDPAGYAGALDRTWALDAGATTPEDRLRPLFADWETARQEVAAAAATYGDFLRDLGVEVVIDDATVQDVDRLAQLARRTNQFNMSLRRHSEADARAVLASADVTLRIEVTDRFGQYGVVGFAIARAGNDELVVEDMFLSCRALGRGVEWATLAELGSRAVGLGLGFVRIMARTGERNQPALDFATATAERFGQSAPIPTSVIVSSIAVAQIDWRQVAQDEAIKPQAPNSASVRSAGARQANWPAPAAADLGAVARAVHRLDRPRPLTVPYMPPTTPLEAKLAAIWSDVLGVKAPGVHDDLLASGGDSLAAATLCGRVRSALGIDVALSAFLDRATIATLASRMGGERDRDATPAESSAVPAYGHDASDGQRRLWAAGVAAPNANDQIIPLAYEIHGSLDPERLEAAIAATIERHAALSGALVMRRDRLLVEQASTPFSLERIIADEGGAQRAAVAFFENPMDPEHGALLRAALIETPADGATLLVAIHHVAADGWSVGLIQRDIGERYQALDRPVKPARPFAEYVRWVAAREDDGRYADALSVLRLMLPKPGAPPRRLRAGQERGTVPPNRQFLRFALSPAARSAVEYLAGAQGLTPMFVHLTALQMAVAFHNGRAGADVACVVANRLGPGHDEIVGFLANIVPISFAFDPNASIGEVAAASTATAFEAIGASDVPYGLLLRDRFGDPYRFEAPFEALFTYQGAPSYPLDLSGCTVATVEPARWPVPFELLFDVEEGSAGTSCRIRYDGALFMPAAIELLARSYMLALQAMAAIPREPVSALAAAVGHLAARSALKTVDRAIAQRADRLAAMQTRVDGQRGSQT